MRCYHSLSSIILDAHDNAVYTYRAAPFQLFGGFCSFVQFDTSLAKYSPETPNSGADSETLNFFSFILQIPKIRERDRVKTAKGRIIGWNYWTGLAARVSIQVASGANRERIVVPIPPNAFSKGSNSFTRLTNTSNTRGYMSHHPRLRAGLQSRGSGL